jgi:hypothetical protein
MDFIIHSETLTAAPDAFPAVQNPKMVKMLSLPKRRRRLWDPEMFTSSRPHRRARSPDIEQENEAPQPRLVRPIPRRFGIFCTGKGSTLSQERVGRPRGPRILAKD